MHRGKTSETETVQADIREAQLEGSARGPAKGWQQLRADHGTTGASDPEAQRPGAREEANRAEEGEASHADPRPYHGVVHRVLVALLLPLYPPARVRHPERRLRDSLLAGVHELRPQPRHLHHLQQRFPAGI